MMLNNEISSSNRRRHQIMRKVVCQSNVPFTYYPTWLEIIPKTALIWTMTLYGFIQTIYCNRRICCWFVYLMCTFFSPLGTRTYNRRAFAWHGSC